MSEIFAAEIEKLARSKNMEYIDSVVLWCERNGYDIEAAALLIKKDPVLKAKIKAEADKMNALKSGRGATLPI